MGTLLDSNQNEEAPTVCVFEQTNVQEAYETHMQENERRLKEAAQLARLGHWELNIVKNELHWSPETFRIFELDPDEHEPSYETFLSMIHPTDRDDVRQQFEDSVQNRRPYNIYHRLILKSGNTKFVNGRCRTLYDGLGRPTRSLGTILDMSEHEREIKKLIRAEAGLEVYALGLEEEIDQLESHLTREREELARARELIDNLQAKLG